MNCHHHPLTKLITHTFIQRQSFPSHHHHWYMAWCGEEETPDRKKKKSEFVVSRWSESRFLLVLVSRCCVQRRGGSRLLQWHDVKIIGEYARKRKEKQHKHNLGTHNPKVAYALTYVHPAPYILNLYPRTQKPTTNKNVTKDQWNHHREILSSTQRELCQLSDFDRLCSTHSVHMAEQKKWFLHWSSCRCKAIKYSAKHWWNLEGKNMWRLTRKKKCIVMTSESKRTMK
jgi:hypothetical protein